jgi:putative ATPase
VALDGGEDPVFIARRLVIFASEDVGNADPLALLLATAALTAVQNIGMPEARINLAHVAIYLAGALKSRKSYEAIELAMSYVKERPTLEVPQRLTNKVKKIVSKIQESPVPIFYHPSDVGREKILKDNLKSLSIMD